MKREYELSNVAKDYLSRFYDILDEMIAEMSGAELTGSISHNFIVQMIPHHRAAIDMSRNLLQYTTNVPLQEIALNIISEQTDSIENMRAIQQCCSEKVNCPRDVKLYQRRVHQIMQVMFSAMGNAGASNNINEDFIREMIPHHEGAIRMSRNGLQYEICSELRPILQAIITSQEKGVREMKRLLAEMERKNC